jgi:hypothetical protein
MSEFIRTAGELRGGLFLDEVSGELNMLVAAVRDTARGGKLIITLAIKPASKDANVLVIEDSVTVKMPRSERGNTILFATNKNTLQRHDPRQPELSGLREVTPMRKEQL